MKYVTLILNSVYPCNLPFYGGNQGGQLLARGLGLCKIIHNHFKNIFYKNVEAEFCEILRISAGDKRSPQS